jgi:very-short-patch-repair endonuclease
MKWSKEKLDELIRLYPNTTNKEIAEILNININLVSKKAKELRIFKSKEHKSRLIKSRTRDLSYKNLSDIAKKYKTKADFQRSDSSAYSAAGVMGIKDDICSHMIPISVSRPQLILRYIIEQLFNKNIFYNTRKIIKPNELDIYLSDYKLAFEYDGKYWHKDKIDSDQQKDKLCLKKNIKLFRINENTCYYRYYLKNIKEQLINYLPYINKYCRTDIKLQQINDIAEDEVFNYINDNILDYDKIKELTQKYDNYKDFKTKEKSLYCKLINLGCISEYTKHMKKDIIYWNIELCKKEIDKYETFKEFNEKSNKCYIHIKKNNLYYLLEKFKDYADYLIRTQRITDEQLKDIIKNLKFKTLEYFRLHHENIYTYLVRNKKLYLIEDLEKKYVKHNIEELLSHDYSKYKNLQEFKKKYPALHSYMLRIKLKPFVKNKIEKNQ